MVLDLFKTEEQKKLGKRQTFADQETEKRETEAERIREEVKVRKARKKKRDYQPDKSGTSEPKTSDKKITIPEDTKIPEDFKSSTPKQGTQSDTVQKAASELQKEIAAKTGLQSTYTAAPTKTTGQKYSEFIGKQISEAEKDPTFAKIAKGSTAFLFSSGVQAAKTTFVDPFIGLFTIITKPEEVAAATKEVIVNPQERERILSQIRQTSAQRPDLLLGTTIGTIGGPDIVTGFTSKIKDAYVKAGAEFVAPRDVFAESVLAGKETLPTAKSTAESLARFAATKDEAGDLFVQTSAPQAITGKKAGVGKKAATGYEDPGIYVTPAGEGSPYFLGIRAADESYTLNPTTLIKDLKGIPTVTKFKAKDVKTYPKSVLEEPGFKGISKYQEEVAAGTGEAYITKRSMIGQGDLKAQKYVSPEGVTKIERGTAEIEAVIPVGQEFQYTPKGTLGKLKGFEKYTEFEGRNVAIREADLLINKPLTPKTKGISQKLTAEQIREEQLALSSRIDGSTSRSPLVSTLRSASNIEYTPTASIQYKQPEPDYSTQKPESDYSKPEIEYRDTPTPEYIIPSDVRVSKGGRSRSPKPPAQPKVSETYIKPSEKPSQPIQKQQRRQQIQPSRSYNPTDYYRNVGKGISTSIGTRQKSTRPSGFFVFVRRKGKFERLKEVLSEEQAVQFGAYTVGREAAATFKVVETDEPITKEFKKKGKLQDFYKKGVLFIEKPERRIKSRGELEEITFKGIGSRRKGLFK